MGGGGESEEVALNGSLCAYTSTFTLNLSFFVSFAAIFLRDAFKILTIRSS